MAGAPPLCVAFSCSPVGLRRRFVRFGAVRAEPQQITQSDQVNGRVQGMIRVAVSRVTGFLRKAVRGSQNRLLLTRSSDRLSRRRVDAAMPMRSNWTAQHRNACGAQTLLPTVAGRRYPMLTRRFASERALAAQIAGARARSRLPTSLRLTVKSPPRRFRGQCVTTARPGDITVGQPACSSGADRARPRTQGQSSTPLV